MTRAIYVGELDPVEVRYRRARHALYGTDVEKPDVWTQDRINRFIVDELRERVRTDQDAVVLWWGPPGSGKSTGSMYLGHQFDPSFNSRTLAERIAFRPLQVPDLYDATPRFGFCQIDEAATAGLLAQQGVAGDQTDLIELINVVRAKNVVLSVLIPDPSELNKSYRARRADYRFEVTIEDDGTRAGWFGRRVRGRKYYEDDGRWLGFDDEKLASPFRWPAFPTADDPELRRMWAEYIPRKTTNMDETVARVRQRMQDRIARREKRAGRG